MEIIDRISNDAEFSEGFFSDKEIAESPIRNFFKGKTIFLTGATGFIGQLLLQKLIRCDVRHVYMLARPKKNQAPMERFQKIFSDVHFKKAIQHNPKFMDCLSIIEGDLSVLGLGIRGADLQLMENTVQVVLHAAADVRFNERIYDLVMTNLRGTRELLKLAVRFQQLEVFNYVSTAYSNCAHGNHIKEEFYEPPIDPDTIIAYAERCSQQPDEFECLQLVTERLLGDWPNTYTFSKSLSEALVRSYGHKIPMCVVRPSIVISTYDDPVPGWCNNFFGMNGIMFGIGSGVIRITYISNYVNLDVVCADSTTNAILATTWTTYEEQQKLKTTDADAVPAPKVYAIVSQSSVDVTFKMLISLVPPMFEKQPSKPIVWSHCLNSTTNPHVFWYLSLFYSFISTVLLDWSLALAKQKTRLITFARKAHIFMYALTYFTQHEWTFEASNMNAVCDRMHPVDQRLFHCDTRLFEMQEWIFTYFQGLKRYLFKDVDFRSEPEARIIYNRMKRLHPFVRIVFYASQAAIVYLLAKCTGLTRSFESMWS